ncbi:D-inositol-3-phosphate glycosyltransferase [Segniliparus rugosus ATCC BAA-974]|uniref:D-inositol-3-phosphate glycosyltransferase n=2 Tax=Segniliparus rugosus TaxID=286804 RepID=E5XS31_SEGRC|nr:D-inositol-3-phosphate glycosyltransferase [Segniliparus rugosus]EFV12816.2 D-inositol-3-phosphate glycosyltransferase [Segniliparus rugosus ATCC BAA-974]
MVSALVGRPPTQPRRVAVLSVHTSPWAQPGSGDAGGMNVYIRNTSTVLARRGVAVEIFTRATSSDDPPSWEPIPGVTLHNVVAGPFEGLRKEELPSQLCAFAAGVLRECVGHAAGHYSLVHSHYWLSGQVGWLLKDRLGVPLVHTAHTLAAVKNATLAEGDVPEPLQRLVGEGQLVAESDRMIVNTQAEAEHLAQYYAAEPQKIDVVAPGVDLAVFNPGDKAGARAALGLDPSEQIVAFVGRIQPLKGPDVLLAAMAEILRSKPGTRLLVVGEASGSGLSPARLAAAAEDLGVAGQVTMWPAQPPARLAQVYRAADLVAVPSHSESFGLVAVEAQACGTPVVAARVGGLPVAVADQVSGVLVDGWEPERWREEIASLLAAPTLLSRMGDAGVVHAARFSWEATVDGLLASYRAALQGAHRPMRAVSV